MGGALLPAALGDFGKRDVGVFDEILHFLEARRPDYVADASSDLGAFVPCVVWQRLGYICETVLGDNEKSDALYRVWRSLGLRTVNTPLSPFERNHDGELNRRWHVKVNLNLELDDL